MTNSNCYYHPEVDEVATCENCNKSLCIVCKIPFRFMHVFSLFDLCPVCHFDYQIKKNSSKHHLIGEILGALIVSTYMLFTLFLLLYSDYEFTNLLP